LNDFLRVARHLLDFFAAPTIAVVLNRSRLGSDCHPDQSTGGL
jgi:hypothetical protein